MLLAMPQKEREEYYMMVSQIFESEGVTSTTADWQKQKGVVSDWTIKSVTGTKELKEDLSDAQMKDTVCRSTLKLLTKRGSHGR
jgi:hypothetical protein